MVALNQETAFPDVCFCSRYRIQTSIPVTSTSAMCPGTRYNEVGGNQYSVPEGGGGRQKQRTKIEIKEATKNKKNKKRKRIEKKQ